MATLLLGLMIVILSESLKYVNDILFGIVPIALRAELTMGTLLTQPGMIEMLFSYFFDLGIAFMIFKFLKKGFFTYIAYTDGDADSDPTILLTNFVQGIIFSATFPSMYNWAANFVNDVLENTIVIMTGAKESELISLTATASAGIFTAILALIFLIMLFILYIRFLGTGIELLILRIGFPLACMGLMDSDSGMFKPYLQKFYQSLAGILIQLILCKLSIALAINGHLFWAIAGMKTTMKLPKFLGEFLITTGGGGSANGIYSTARMGEMGHRMYKTFGGGISAIK